MGDYPHILGAMKTVQVNIEEALLENVDQFIQKKGITRSAFVRESLELNLKRQQMREADEKHRLSYLEYPQDLDEIHQWEKEQVWPEE